MSQNTLATWEDIPAEILEEILSYLDNPSIFAVSKLNRLSNRVALARLLGPQIMDQLFLNSSIQVTSDSPQCIVPVLRTALWLPPISRINHATIVPRLPQDVPWLEHLIKRLPRGHLEEFRLHILTHPRDVRRRDIVHVSECSELIKNLVGAAFSKGCRTLEISGDLPDMTEDVILTLCFWLKPPFIARFSQIVRNATCRLIASLSRQPRQLESLTVKCAPFVHFIFPQIISIISLSSQTLQKLELDVPPFPRFYFLDFVKSLHLPHLTSLILTYDSFPLPPQTLLALLSHHPQLRDLELFVYFKRKPDEESLQAPPLPNLENLRAFPQIIQWFFSLKSPSSPNLTTNNHYPSLKSVHILSYSRTSDINIEMQIKTNTAILVLNACFPSTDAAPADDDDLDNSVCLILDMDPGRWRYENGDFEDDSVNQPSLEQSRVRWLILSSRKWSQFFTSLVIPLARWLALFSALEKLEITSPLFETDLSNQQFCDEIVQRFPRLKVLKYQGSVIDVHR